MAKEQLAIHYVNTDGDKVTINRKSNTNACEFDFPIFELAPNINREDGIKLGGVIAKALDEELMERLG